MTERAQLLTVATRRAVLALLSVTVTASIVAGCGRSTPQQAEIDRGGPDAVDDPAATLERFTAAARDRDVDALWGLLSARTRTRLGPDEADFRRRAPSLERRVSSFTSANRYRTILSEPLGGGIAVAAVARSGRGPKGPGAYALALRFERGAWRIELGGSLRLRALLPPAGGSVRLAFPQLALEIRSRTPIVSGALWLDGVPFSAGSGGVNPRWITIWGRTGVPLEPGEHFVVGYADTATERAALAWSFDVAGAPGLQGGAAP